MKIKQFEKLVLESLEENETTRKDDFMLYLKVLQKLGVDIYKKSIFHFLLLAKISKMPPFETISRCRRRLQKKRPELKDEETAKARMELVEEYKNYNKNS